MAYTLAQSITKVRELINEASASFWSDTQITGWLQDATIDISTKLLCVVGSDTITLVENQYKYISTDESWIATCLKPKAVWYSVSATNLRGLQLIQPHFIGHLDMMDETPKYYYYDSTQRAFYINPTPNFLVNGTTIIVDYCYQTNDITLLKDEHQPLAFLYGAAKAKIKERMYGEASALMNEYRNSLVFERQDKFDLGTQPTSEFTLPNDFPQVQR